MAGMVADLCPVFYTRKWKNGGKNPDPAIVKISNANRSANMLRFSGCVHHGLRYAARSKESTEAGQSARVGG